MEKFSAEDLEFLAQGEAYYSGGTPTWTDERYDVYRKVFESKFGPVMNYIKSAAQGKHVDHRPSGRFNLMKVSIKMQYADRVHEMMTENSSAYWMFKYDGTSLVAYYNNGKLVQVCTKSAVEWGIDRTPNLSWLFPQVVDPKIDSIQGEAVVKVSKVGGEYAARSKANGLISSKYKVDEIKEFIHVRAFKVGFVDLNPSIKDMLDALQALPIPEHGRFQIAKRLTNEDVTESAIGSEDFLYDGVVCYDPNNNSIIGYKRHSDEHLLTKVTNIEWNKAPSGAYIPKWVFETVVFNAQYNDEGQVIGGIRVSKAATGSANRLFGMRAGVGSIVEVVRANSTIPAVTRVVTPADDFDLLQFEPKYYEEGYEYSCPRNPWEVLEHAGYKVGGHGVYSVGESQAQAAPESVKVAIKKGIDRWCGIHYWLTLAKDKPGEFLVYLILGLKGPQARALKSLDPNITHNYALRLLKANIEEFNKVIDELTPIIRPAAASSTKANSAEICELITAIIAEAKQSEDKAFLDALNGILTESASIA